MSNVKGKGQRLIPEELLKYLEKQNKKYPNPESLGTEVTANVEPVGGESNLTSIKIGNTVYLIPSGGTLEDIVDSAGNKRFIEGNLDYTLNTQMYPLTNIYSKWSLSGTHLMIVGVLANETETTITPPTNVSIFELEIPQWIFAKIVPINAENGLISRVSFVDSNGTTNIYFRLFKSTTKLVINGIDSGIYSGRQVRFQFDLLIDSE